MNFRTALELNSMVPVGNTIHIFLYIAENYNLSQYLTPAKKRTDKDSFFFFVVVSAPAIGYVTLNWHLADFYKKPS